MQKETPSKTKRRRGARPRRGTLILVSGLLIGSALVRAGSDAGRALALQGQPMLEHSDTHGPISEIRQAEPDACSPPPDIAAMLAAFKEREARIGKREAQMQARMQALNVADGEIESRMAALAEAEESLRATLALADSAAEKDLARLTSVYENMKPKDAAALFEEMDPSFSAGFLGRMRPEAAAAIMAGLTPKSAYTISAILAGRNADVPKE